MTGKLSQGQPCVSHRAPRKSHAEPASCSRLGEERKQLADDIHRHPPSCQRQGGSFWPLPLSLATSLIRADRLSAPSVLLPLLAPPM